MVKIYRKDEIDKLAHILINDGVIAVPTDTVYGICAKIDSKKAYNRIIKIKNRQANKSFPVMCANEKQIKEIAVVNKMAEKLIKVFMPGPITLILKKKEDLPDYVTNGKDTIAVRMATSKELERLIKMAKSPVFMTSANKSNEPVCKSLDEIEKACPDLDGIMDGDVFFGEASTIVDCSKEEINILRNGPITEKQINEAIHLY